MVPIDPATVTDGHVYLFEGGAPSDSSALGHDGTVAGAPQTVDGLNGDALQFDGAADGIDIADSDYINVNGGPFGNRTVIAVFKCDDVHKPGKQTVFEEGGTTRGSNIYVSEGLLYVAAWNRAEYNWDGAWPSVPIESGQWYVAAMVIRDGGEAVDPDKFEMWLNGDLVAQEPGGHLHNHADDGAFGYTRVNTVFHDGNASPALGHYFGGTIDEVWILNEALTPAQLGSLGPNPALAKNEVPENESTDVLRNGVLTWEPGKFARVHDVYLGTAFNDVNEATRDNPLDVLGSQDQTEASYDPGTLEFGQTYYWRVDEVNGAPDRTVFTGDVWSFTVEPYSIPIADITATASSSHTDDMGPENTINGVGLNELDQHSTEATEMWLSGMGDSTPSIQYEFDKTYKLDEMWVWNSNQPIESFLGLGAKDVTVEYSVDGAEWTSLENVPEFAQATSAPTYEANTTVDFGGAVAKSVRLTINTGYGMLPQYGLSAMRFFYVPTQAREPQPADGITTEVADIVLSWRSGREAASSEVYLGTDAADLALLGTTTGNSMPATDVEYGTTYFWSVTEINEAEAVTSYPGDVWSFTVPAAGIVDNFELYDDNCNRIFFAWEDGLGHNGGEDIDGCDVPASNGNGSGSILGNATAPFAEQAIVHSGSQSLPYSYDGDSEASLNVSDLALGQDWTKGAATTLVLWVRGDLGNAAADQLYVKINNSKVTYDGDLSVPIWTQWNIDLAASGANLSSVNTLTVGVEASSVGMLYLDDIALYRVAPAIVEPASGSDPSLVAHWKLDETTGLDVADSSGYGNNGTLIGMDGTEWTAGILDGALEITGGSAATQKYVEFENVSSLQLFDSATISAWVKMNPDNADVYMGIAGKLVSGYYRGFALVRHSSNVFRLWCDNGDGVLAGHDASSDNTYTDTEWHHVVGVIDNGTSTLYVDGVRQAQEGSVDLTDSGTYAHIGKQYSDESSHRYWNGLIDDVRIYYRALSAQEIADL